MAQEAHGQLIKFPKTPHLTNLGGATGDDAVMDNQGAMRFLARGRVIVEEKVDGANLGISFATAHGPARCQKRGRWVTPDSEAQFAKLQAWLETHQEDLRAVLGTRYILYGEWCAARHTVPYDALPDWFLAYDVYDAKEGRFLSSSRRNAMLQSTRLHTVPSLVPAPGRTYAAKAGLDELCRTVMGLTTGLCVGRAGRGPAVAEAGAAPAEAGTRAEGVYLRLESADGQWLEARAKLVHPAFIQAIEGDEGPGGGAHWTRRATEWNRVRPDLWPDRLYDSNEPYDKVDEQATAPQDQAVRQEEQDQEAVKQAASAAGESVSMLKKWSWEDLVAPDCPNAVQLQLCCGGQYVALVGKAVDKAARWALNLPGAVPDAYIANRLARDGPSGHHHLTLVTPPEMDQLRARGVSNDQILNTLAQQLLPHGLTCWLPLGLGRARAPASTSGPSTSTHSHGAPDTALYLVVAWPAGQAARAALGLGARQHHFHITLGFDRADVHDRPKGLSTLAPLAADGGRASGALLNGQAVQQLANCVVDAGLHVTRVQQAAVLVAHAMQGMAPAPSTTGTATSTATGSSTVQAGTPAASSSPVPCSPEVMDALRAMLQLALAWIDEAATGTAGTGTSQPSGVCTHGRKGSGQGRLDRARTSNAGAAAAAPAAAGSTAAASRQGPLVRDLHWVRGCAHVALARLAGRNCEMHEVDEHVRHALVAAGTLVTPATDAAGGDGVLPAGTGVAAVGGLLEAVAGLLGGKALAQRERYEEAAGAFRRAAGAYRRWFEGGLRSATPDASPRGGDSVSLLLPALLASGGPLLDQQALAKAAQACERKLRAAPAAAPTSTPALPTGAVTPQQGAGGAAALAGPTSGVSAGPLDPRERAVVRLPAAAAAQGGRATAAGAGSGAAAGGEEVTLMRNTSWVVEGVLMGSSTPKRPEQIRALAALGVRLVVTLTEEDPLPPAWFDPAVGVANLFVPVTNYEPPSVRQMDDILAAMEQYILGVGLGRQQQQQQQQHEGQQAREGAGQQAANRARAVLVHCGGGKGRAGTVLACYLCKHGVAAPEPGCRTAVGEPAMSADAAVRLIRSLRPGSIETEQQRRFVGRYGDELWRRYDQQQKLEQQQEQQPHEQQEQLQQQVRPDQRQQPQQRGLQHHGAQRVPVQQQQQQQQPRRGRLQGSDRAGRGASATGRTVGCAAAGTSAAAPAAGNARAAGSSAASAAAGGSDGDGGGSGSGCTPGGYPSTPHLPFSPQVAEGDTQLDARGCSALLGVPLVITEKLDGGNCCIANAPDGSGGGLAVFARTHKHHATHASFGPVKQLAAEQLAGEVPEHIALFGENMTAVHSIAYESVPSYFFLFGVWDSKAQVWCSWPEVEAWAQQLGLHTVPVLRRGVTVSSLSELEALLHGLMQQPSALDGASPREGFVVRTLEPAIPAARFPHCVAKYVRQGHVQTDDTWRRTWRRAAVSPQPPPAVCVSQEVDALVPEPEEQQRMQEQQQAGRPSGRAAAEGVVTGPSAVAANASSVGPGVREGLRTVQQQERLGEDIAPKAGAADVQEGQQAAGQSRAQESGGQQGPEQGQRQQRQGRPAGRPSGPPPRNAPRLVMLVGLPGSGKSTFARALEATGWWTRVCQDDCGNRGAAEAAFGAAMLRGTGAGAGRHVVLDRCSPDAADRKAWLALGLVGKRDRGIVAVFFDVDVATCKARVAARPDHPTIPQGRGGRIVDSFAARLQPPTTAEGFERVHTVRNEDDANALLAAWSAGPIHVDAPPPALLGLGGGAAVYGGKGSKGYMPYDWDEYERQYGGGDGEDKQS